MTRITKTFVFLKGREVLYHFCDIFEPPRKFLGLIYHVHYLLALHP